jgi:hypothetical protein
LAILTRVCTAIRSALVGLEDLALAEIYYTGCPSVAAIPGSGTFSQWNQIQGHLVSPV